jgi:hypothetical protein
VHYTTRLDSGDSQPIGGEIGIVVTRYQGLIVPDERKGPLSTRSPESGRVRAALRDLTAWPAPIPCEWSADRSGSGSIR